AMADAVETPVRALRPAPSRRTQSIAVTVAAFGQNAVLRPVTTFLPVYLLQYAHLSTAGLAVVTTIITAAKIFDAITDPIMGGIVDLTRTRWGKLRPYLLFSAAPVAILTTLL